MRSNYFDPILNAKTLGTTPRTPIITISLIALLSLASACASTSEQTSSAVPTTAAAAQSLPGAYLQVTLDVAVANRGAAADVYLKYRQPFLSTIDGALSKDLILRDDDVQVLHGFSSAASATAYLKSSLFTQDVVVALTPYLAGPPDVRVYEVLSK